MKDTTSRGDLAEWEVAAALIRDGRKLLRPMSSASRYDLAIDNDGSFIRIQCKTGILREGRIEFRLYSMSGHRGTRGKTYEGQIDAFGVYCPQTCRAYLGQNLQGRHSELRVEADFEVNQKAEAEVETILQHLSNQNDLMLEILRRIDRLEQARGVAPTS